MLTNQPPADPFRLFHTWYEEATATGIKLPEAMALATATRRGVPSVRMVLLRHWSRRGFQFYTNYESRKGRELADNPRAALLFYWSILDRQVRIAGPVSRVSRRASVAYFRTRPRESQIAAWASPQSQEIAGREALDAAFAHVAARFHGKPVPCPPHWGGFRLEPTEIEFWQGRDHRLHDRLQYCRRARGWSHRVLGP